jgi:hypothetical protein
MSDASPHGPAILGVLELATYFFFEQKRYKVVAQ